MTLIRITDEERERFAAYLQQEADSEDGLCAQMATLGLPEAVLDKRKTLADALRAVSRWLSSWERS